MSLNELGRVAALLTDDYQMPDLNGVDVARQISELFPKIPILMVTLHLSNQLAEAAREAGVRGACAKQDIGSVVEAVEVLLANVAKPATRVAPAKGKRNKDAPKSKRRHTARAAAKDAITAREGSKKAEVIGLMRRSQGATLAEIMELTVGSRTLCVASSAGR